MTQEEKLIQYLRRSYTAVDGLWFVMIEDDHGLDMALDFDEKVWKVMGKIQAREAGRLAGRTGEPLRDLRHALALKFQAEDYEHQVDETDDGFVFRITRCPWYEILKRADREHLAPVLSQRICVNEYQAWAKEFSCHIKIEKGPCIGAPECLLRIQPVSKG